MPPVEILNEHDRVDENVRLHRLGVGDVVGGEKLTKRLFPAFIDSKAFKTLLTEIDTFIFDADVSFSAFYFYKTCFCFVALK